VEVFGITAGLLLGLVGIEIFALGFEYGEGVAVPVVEEVIDAAAVAVQFQPHLPRVEQVPTAILEGLVDTDARVRFGL
jgi:hypothetical protein